MTTAMQDDLAYLKDLAQAGQDAPLLGGRFLAWWGGITALAYAGHFGLESGQLDLGVSAYGWLWISYLIVGIMGQIVLILTMSPSKPGQSSLGNRVESNIWMMAGFVLFAFFGSLMLKALLGGDASGFAYSIPMVFGAYAISLFTSGAISKTPALVFAAYTSLAIIALAVWFQGTAFIWAIAAIGVFLTVFLPGLALMRAEPKSLV